VKGLQRHPERVGPSQAAGEQSGALLTVALASLCGIVIRTEHSDAHLMACLSFIKTPVRMAALSHWPTTLPPLNPRWLPSEQDWPLACTTCCTNHHIIRRWEFGALRCLYQCWCGRVALAALWWECVPETRRVASASHVGLHGPGTIFVVSPSACVLAAHHVRNCLVVGPD